MLAIFKEHRGFWTPEHKRSLYFGIMLILIALVVHLAAGFYSADKAAIAPSVHDLFLDNLPVVNLDFLIVGGNIIFFWIIPVILFAVRPRYLLFAVKAIALFVIIRAFFTTLTHIGIYPDGAMPSAANLGYSFYELVNFQGNLFFSGHTGYPFLIALIFWNNVFWRRFYVGATVVFAAAVLLAHVHYSIDVFAAPFIVYGIYTLAARFFPDDFALSVSSRI